MYMCVCVRQRRREEGKEGWRRDGGEEGEEENIKE